MSVQNIYIYLAFQVFDRSLSFRRILKVDSKANFISKTRAELWPSHQPVGFNSEGLFRPEEAAKLQWNLFMLTLQDQYVEHKFVCISVFHNNAPPLYWLIKQFSYL